jgi:hypothetical protein
VTGVRHAGDNSVFDKAAAGNKRSVRPDRCDENIGLRAVSLAAKRTKILCICGAGARSLIGDSLDNPGILWYLEPTAFREQAY